ncbi:hypothetical protein [Alicyclobacillus fructus]|uniref:hypothetical protein n=1 Tax=Alicyclobacillus fructus TaxID=2816082 RepID=UPI001F438397|nr:hypothetical protein [Alicyclobacillus fructus]
MTTRVRSHLLRWRKAGPEQSNLNRTLFMIFGILLTIALFTVLGVLLFHGFNAAKSSGENALNSITQSSGTASSGGYSAGYSGNGNFTLPNFSSTSGSTGS